MQDNSLKANDQLVNALRRAAFSSNVDLMQVPALLKKVLVDNCWQDRIVVRTGERVCFVRFEDFVRTPPLEGMGADIPMLKRICAQDPEALDLLDQATQQPHGGDRRSKDFNGNNVTIGTERPEGNSSAKALRRLRKDRPDLHALVLAGDLTPHAAMIEAGFRQRTIPMPLDPARLAQRIKTHLSPTQIDALIALLRRQEDSRP